jgi:hypothetical protein
VGCRTVHASAALRTATLVRSLAALRTRRIKSSGVVYIAATVYLPHQTEGRAYLDRKVAVGKTPMKTLRGLQRIPGHPPLPNTGPRHDAQAQGWTSPPPGTNA